MCTHALLVAVVLAGCAPGRMYQGPQRPDGEVALVVTDASSGLEIESVGEREAAAGQDRFEILPGRHILQIQMHPPGARGLWNPTLGRLQLTFEAEPGHVYRVRGAEDVVGSKRTAQVDDAGPSRGAGRGLAPVAELERACSAGRAVSCVELGAIYERGSRELGWDEARAAALYQQACAGDRTTGCLELGRLYESGHGLPRDEGRAAASFAKACGAAEAPACTRLGLLYQEGRGVPKDGGQASRLYEQACGSGDPAACTRLAALLREDPGKSAGEKRVAALYEQGCAGGDPHGCSGLGILYEDGEGVEYDASRAAALYEKGCAGGSAIGCANLGVLYHLGLGVPQSERLAVEMFRKGCAKGAMSACANLKNLPSEGGDAPQAPSQPLPPPREPPAGSPGAAACAEHTPVGSHIPVRDCGGGRAVEPETRPVLAVPQESRGWSLRLGLRAETDLLQRGFLAAVSGELSRDQLSAAGAILLRSSPAFRLEGRFSPFQQGPFRLYAALGASVFIPAMAGRAAVGVEMRIAQVHLSADLAGERFFNPAPGYAASSLLFSLGAGWRF